MQILRKIRLSSFQTILLGFIAVILIGALLLTLPAASADGVSAPFPDALFTATSAVCVTGLVVRDTATSWSGFGKLVLLVMIQIGGLGVVTAATFFAVLSRRKLGVRFRSILQESVSAEHPGGILRFVRFILLTTLCVEGAGALLLLPSFASEYGFGKAVWLSVFHSVSAFCNAGFDLCGERAAFSSLTAYRANVPVNLVILPLILIGGIGFHTLSDLLANRFRLSRCRLQTKLILAVSGLLVLVPAVLFFFLEFGGLTGTERVLASLFQSVTTRTAGFNTADFAGMSEAGQLMTVFLMLVGGSPGSTAGGAKTTTLAVLVVSAVAVFRRRRSAQAFRRALPSDVVRSACAIWTAYLALFLAVSAVMSRIEGLPLLTAMFETASAIGTVGLTLGITPQLGTVSRILLIFLMYFGRVGGLTLIYATLPANAAASARYPEESVSVG